MVSKPHKTAPRPVVTSRAPVNSKDSTHRHGARAAQGTTSAPKAGMGWIPGDGEVGVRVRMYRVGFGDFFLISCLQTDGAPLHIIVDCGVFKGTSQTGDIKSIEAAVADMVQTTSGKVALIIMTHRHADHIAGFARCADTFKSLAVGGVWMPIWESEYEPTALKFQAELTRTALGLREHLTQLCANLSARHVDSEPEDTARKYTENATGELDAAGVAATGSNAKALELLKRGLAGVTPEYYQGGDTPKVPKVLAEAGLTARILGPPPIADSDLMKLMDLQKGVGQYLSSDDGETESCFEPFGPQWEIDPLQEPNEFYLPASFAEWFDARRPEQATTPVAADVDSARKKMQDGLKGTQSLAALIAAKQLNAFLNNQSLVVLFTFKGKNLLFVGDAQAGNWEHWLFDTDSPDKKASGTVDAAARQILTNLHFYKVGHHGSGNATPKLVVELMGTRNQRFPAMCSTQKDVYGTENPEDPAKGTEVPRDPLLQQLGSQSALVRSDQVAITVDGKEIAAPALAALPPSAPGSRFETGALWIDCFL
jgi:hypothetical protein